jgi:hypothetical protein
VGADRCGEERDLRVRAVSGKASRSHFRLLQWCHANERNDIDRKILSTTRTKPKITMLHEVSVLLVEASEYDCCCASRQNGGDFNDIDVVDDKRCRTKDVTPKTTSEKMAGLVLLMSIERTKKTIIAY